MTRTTTIDVPPPPPSSSSLPIRTADTNNQDADIRLSFQQVCASIIDHDTLMGQQEDVDSIHHHDDIVLHDTTSIRRHDRLRRRPWLWAAVGVSQTFLTAIMFGWASLVPVLRAEGLHYTPSELSQIFTCGAVGNYLATLPFGVLLDWQGPSVTGIYASLLYALGLVLCSLDEYFYCFAIGFGLVGLARPGIQMPTLHLANLFHGSGHGGAVYMSCQAAAFDAGTLIFFLFNQGYFRLGLSSSTMFLMYLAVPAWTLTTAIFVWPNETLEKEQPSHDDGSGEQDSMVGSPHWSPRDRQRRASQQEEQQNRNAAASTVAKRGLVNAPLRVVLTHVSFYTLATWVGIHIYKLNFIVATINDQVLRHYSSQDAKTLIDILGAMLPFGFVVLPVVATMLHTKPMMALQVANVVGILYGGVMVYCPHVAWMLVLIVFPAVATSRQLVYSTLFHTIAQIFGFSNYGVLLGLTNAIASLFQMFQTPMVNWSEDTDSYLWSNFILWAVTFPLLVSVLYTDPTWTPNWKWLAKRRRGNTKRLTTKRHELDKDDSGDATPGAVAVEPNERTSLLYGVVSNGIEEGGGVGGGATVVSTTSSSTDATSTSFRQ